ncbi:hypothetical protein [Sinomicrobium soli]|uniref:hypothetical protein n=1 Tax=Sinomicrobium sp. N-1-3-6 TaxID=2219864 RepID=UPI000DDB3848|nr:hypothetical protein [Sinomicrobium sp. N-1-3-6]
MMDFGDQSSIVYIVVIAVLFLLVLWNSRRNSRRWKDRKRKSFRDQYYDRKRKERSGENDKDHDR